MSVLQIAHVESSLFSLSETGGHLELLYWSMILIAALLAIAILALVLRKFLKGRRDAIALDTDFLEGIREKLSPDEMRRVRETALRKLAEQQRMQEETTLSIEDLKSFAEGKKPPSPTQGGQDAVPPAAPKPARGRWNAPAGKGVGPEKKVPAKPAAGEAPLPTDAKRVSSGKVEYYADLGDVGPKKVVTSLEDILVSRRKTEKKTPPGERVVAPKTEAAQKMKPVDVKELLKRGLITDQEFERLQGYFHKEEEKEDE